MKKYIEAQAPSLEALVRACLVFKDTCGDREFIAFLQQELARENIIYATKCYHAALLDKQQEEIKTEVDISTSDDAAFDALIKALEFYANKDNYRPTKSKPRSWISEDRGKMARATLQGVLNEEDDA